MKWDEKNEVVLNLVEKVDLSDDKWIYIFYFKKGVKFINGREVKVEDFKWCWEWMMNFKFISVMVDIYMLNIVGVYEWLSYKGNGEVFELSGVKVKDDYMLEVMIDKLRFYFFDKLIYVCIYVYVKEVLVDLLKDMLILE